MFLVGKWRGENGVWEGWKNGMVEEWNDGMVEEW
jgi:hypothetical protein